MGNRSCRYPASRPEQDELHGQTLTLQFFHCRLSFSGASRAHQRRDALPGEQAARCESQAIVRARDEGDRV